MNDIVTKQNSPELIEFLKAQRIAYNQCKKLQIFDIVSILIAIILPLIAIKNSDYQNPINAFGFVWTVAYLITLLYRSKKTIEAATIQEQFDTQLYDLEWNKVLCKKKINIDTIQKLSSKYKESDLNNWYSTKISSSLPKEIAIILCQRINFSWEINQRKKFVNFLTITTVLYYLIYIVIGSRENTGFYDLLTFLSPSVPFLVFNVQNVLSLKQHIKTKNETLNFIDSELEKYSHQKNKPTYSTIRQIQDAIFSERIVPEKVPNWFYRINKYSNESFIDNLIDKIQNNF